MERITLHSADGTHLSALRQAPESPRGHTLFVHGYADHVERYTHVFDALNAAGFAVTAIDLRGHGRSEGRRGHIDNWEQYIDDLRAAERLIEGPYAVVCHSMGGLVCLDHLRDAQGPWAAAVHSPLLGVAVEAPAWKIAAAGFLSRWWPTLKMGNELDPTAISTIVEEQVAYAKDPLGFTTLTPRWYTEMTAATERVLASSDSYDVPLLLQWGESDKIVSIEAIEEFAKGYGGSVETVSYPDHRHELFREVRRDDAIARLVAFLDAELPS